MKKSLVIIGATVVVLLITAVALPVLFKGRIQKAVDRSINEAVRANVSYGEFSLSLLKGFPNLSLSIEQLSVVGMEQFKGDTLVAADKIAITVNPIQAMFSDKLTINRIVLVRPRLLVKILEDGTANYDITVERETENSAKSTYQLSINKWTVEDGSLSITDQQSGVFMDMQQVNHEGTGDFSQDLFELSTSSRFQLQNLSYQGLAYLGNKEILAEVTLEMNLSEAKYTFKENQVSINQFTFGFDGWVSMPEGKEDILMDISFATHQNEFRHLLSCVPGMYREGFDEINSSGLVTMNGKANGIYNSAKVPAFQFSLRVDDGMFQYPDLPTPVKNISFEMLVANEDGNPDHLLVDLNTLHLEFGQNPLDGSLKIDGLAAPEIKMNMTTSLDLAELTGIFPMEGTTLRGTYELSLNAEGTYDSAAQRFPVVEASMKLQDGFIKSEAFPESLEQFNLTSTVSNKSGHLPDTRIEIPDFSFLMDGEAFAGRLTLVNPHDYSWDLAVDGGINLEKMVHILSLEEIVLEGIVRGNLTTTGKISSLEAEKYEEIPTSGDFTIEAFSYTDSELGHPFQISSGRASFTPQQITLTNIKALTGATDLKVNGGITNYINYMFKENAPISGALKIESENVDLNEWVTDSPANDVVNSLSVLEVPLNIDFDLEVKASTVQYDNLTLRNVRGQVLVNDGMARLHDLSFNSLGGGFLVSGTYDPRDLAHPKFNLGVEMQEVAFKEAYNSFNIVQTLAPVAQLINGNFSTNLKINGELQPDMMPSLGTLSANGLVNVVSAALSASESKLMQGFAEITQFQSGPAEFNLNDVVMAVKIKNGQMDVAPFAVTFGDYRTMVSGSTGIDGTMNFMLNMEVPAGVVGTSVNQAIANLTGNDQPVNDKVNLNLKLSGSYADPQFRVGGLQGGNTTAGLAKSAVSQKSYAAMDSAAIVIDEQTQKLTQTAQQQIDSIVVGNIKDSIASESIKSAAKDLINKEKVEGVLDIFKKKSKEEGN